MIFNKVRREVTSNGGGGGGDVNRMGQNDAGLSFWE